MCYVVDSEVVLANYLFRHPTEKLSPRKLGELQNKIYANVKDSLYVDITDNSVCSAVKRLNFLFEWDKENRDNVVRASESNRYYDKKYIDAISYDVPPHILRGLIEACK